MKPPAGRCYWAVAPFSPRPPFRLYAGEGSPPREVQSVSQMTAAARKAMSEFVMLMPVKARPVLVITGVLEPYDEVLALRLHRLEKLTGEERKRVRDHDDPALFYLEPGSFPGLPVQNAGIVTALLRLPVASLDTSSELGSLTDHELRLVHEHVVTAHGLTLDRLVLDRARELLDRLKDRSGGQ